MISLGAMMNNTFNSIINYSILFLSFPSFVSFLPSIISFVSYQKSRIKFSFPFFLQRMYH